MRRLFTLLAVIALLIAVRFAATPRAQGTQAPDLVIRNAHVIDGAGNPWFLDDVAVAGDTIVAIGRALPIKAQREIDGAGLVLAPGFIDIHTHARRGIFEVPTADNYTRQGVTTVVEGPDGSSPLPLGAFLDKVAAARMSPNFASFVGQGSVREQVMGEVDRPATPEEIERMRAIVAQAMNDGAFGLSSGLFYVPGTFTPTAEVVELAKVAGRMGGMYISHMRDEASKVTDSVRETIAIGEQGALPTQLTHHKIIGPANWGRSVDTLRLVDEARARGVDATIDQYPYTASSTSIQSALLPAWALEGGRPAVLKRLQDPSTRATIRAESVSLLKNERGGGDPKNVVIARCEWDASLAGKSLSDIVAMKQQAVTLEAAADAAIWIVEQGGCQGIFHAIDERDLVRILAHPATMIASDGEVTVFGKANPHPRSYGTFVRVLGRYVREQHVLTLQDAIRKMTSFPARRLGLHDRGLVREGMKADLVLFDPSRVGDRATFENPHQYAEGIHTVIVNGQVIFENGSMTAARPGRVLRGPASTIVRPKPR